MKKLLKVVGGLFVLIMVIGIIGSIAGKSDSGSSTQASTTATPSAPRPPSAQERMQAMIPTDEAALVAAVEAARQQYAAAANDMAKGAARPARGQAICKVLRSAAVEGWVGRVSDLSTNGEGKGVLAIEIGSKASVKTWNNGLSDIGDHTLIEPTSALFGTASQLHTGQLVRFSGTLIPDQTDCVKETSMSLSGSIREPEYLFRFRSIAAVN